jgi:LuxR family transcriptional regulator, maltose regulon positive regulatory protein
MGKPPGPAAPEGRAAGLDALIATKLHVPRARHGLVPRPRLVDWLTEALAGELIVVCAPAGFGKTALLADWARRSGRAVAWLSLDTADNDPVRFWRHVAAALGGARAGAGQRLTDLLGPRPPRSLEAVVTALVNELAAAPGEVVLVLDDYHLIEARAVHESVVFLLEHLPAGLRLAVACRADPPLPLARLRARGELAELRAGELRFTRQEAAALLRETAGPGLPDDAVAALEARTEGWAAGLQLAALSLRGQEDTASFVAAFSGSHRYVLDYLAEEVLDRQPEQVRTFLLETSVLEQLCGALCDAVTGRGGSQQLLEMIERANLFLVPLDEVRGWWRYHPLFADLLHVRLRQEQPERLPGLHRAAAAWCQQRGLADDAVRHALAAGDAAWAARLVERHIGTTLAWGEGATVTRWLADLPGEQVRARPRLCALRAIQAIMAGQAGELERWLDAAEAASRAGERAEEAAEEQAAAGWEAGWLPADMPGTLTALRADLARLRGDAEGTIGLAHQVLARLPAGGEGGGLRFNAEWNLARAFWLNGELGQAEHALAGLTAAAQPAGENLAMAVRWEHGQVLRAQGRLRAALASYRQALAAGIQKEGPELPALGMMHLGIAAVLYEQDELAGALEHATEGLAGARQLARGWSVTPARQLAEALVILAWIRWALGDQAAATAAISEAGEVGPSPDVVDLFNPAGAERIRLLLAQGQVAQAAGWAAARRLDPDDQPGYPREREYLLLARLLITQGEPERARPVLGQLHASAAAQERTGSLIELGAVTAQALAACGEKARAVAALAEALALAWPEGYLRVFADEGAPLAAVLDQLIAGQRSGRMSPAPGVPQAYLRRLRAAFRPRDGRAVPPSALAAAEVAAPGLAEPLTGRELQVLALLAAGTSNQQIASELVVALETVKKHVSHILGKLGAANRTQAVAHARALGLLR